MSKNIFPVINPATEEIITWVENTTSTDWNEALGKVIIAGQKWQALTFRDRGEILRSIFDEILRNKSELAQLITQEMGKPINEAEGEVVVAADFFRWFSEEAVRWPGRITPSPVTAHSLVVTRKPVGPVLAISPWNFPISMAARKIAPALAAGCPVLVKPAAQTPLSMIRMGEIIDCVFSRFGLEESPVKVLPTTNDAELSSQLMSDPRLAKVTFTGSTRVGRILVKQSATRLLRTSMELGGNAPYLVHEDADLSLAAQGACHAKTRNTGQVCVAANRIIVHQNIISDFTKLLVNNMKQVKMGPMISSEQRSRCHEIVEDAVRKGAKILCGGYIPEGKGYFYPATVLTEIPANAKIRKEEIFGPVAAIYAYQDLEQAIAMANDTEAGLAAYAWTSDLNTANRFAKEICTGMIAINDAVVADSAAPFGGIKQSGFGREGGTEGIEEYLEIRYVRWPQ